MIPSHYRKSETARKLYATQKFLAAQDTTSPILKDDYDREIVKTAVDRRRALMEYEAADHLREYFRIERSAIVNALIDGRDDLDVILDSLREDLGITLSVVQRGAAEEWGDWARAGHGFTTKAVRDPVTPWLKRNLGTQIKGITETTRKKLAAKLAEGQAEGYTLREQAQQIDQFYLDEIIPNRSMTIARTEVGRAVNWSQQQIAEEVDVPMEKEWLSLDDDRTRSTHVDADGQRVGINDPFTVGMSELQYPGDPAGPADEVINCRCTVLHHVVDEQPRHKSARVQSPYEFAKSVLAIENAEVITMLAFAKGVFTEADEWTTARDIVMKHVYRLRRTEKAWDESKVNRDPGGEGGGQFVSGGGVDEGALTSSGSGPTTDDSDRAENTSHMPPAQRERVQHYEAELLARNYGPRGGTGKERMVVLRADGSVLIDKEGGKNHVNFMGSEIRMISMAKDGVGTHNHPKNVTLSAQDVMVAWQMDLTEIRAVGREYTYAMRPLPGKKWPPALITKQMNDRFLGPLSKEAELEAHTQFDTELSQVDRKDKAAVKAYNKRVLAWNVMKNVEIQHKAWLQAAPMLSLEYTRVPNPKPPKKGK